MAKLTEEEYSALEAKYAGKRLARVEMASGTFVFRQPTRQEHRIFKAMILDSTTTATAYDDLFLRTVVSPEMADAAKMLEDRPGLTSNKKIIQALNRLSGQEDEEEGKG